MLGWAADAVDELLLAGQAGAQAGRRAGASHIIIGGTGGL